MNFDKLLNFKLKPWQSEPVTFIRKVKRGCILDDVGLGKTIESLALVESLRKDKEKCKTLLVVEPPNIYQWAEEVRKFTSQEPFLIKSKASKESRKQVFKDFNKSEDSYMIINYDKILHDFDLINSLNFNVLIFDEGSILSNLNKTREFSTWLIRNRDYVFILTATPITRDILQFYDLFSTLGIAFSDRNDFIENFCIYKTVKIRSRRGPIIKKVITGVKHFKELRKLYKPFYIRRKKEDVKEFLEVTQKNPYYNVFEMSKEQKDLYEEAKNGIIEVCKNGELDFKELGPLQKHSAWRQILNSCYFIDNRKEKKSPKLEGLLNLIPTFKKEKVIVYAWMVEYCDLVNSAILSKGYSSVVYHGELSEHELNEAKREFVSGDAQFFVCTAKGKKGHNFQHAHNLVFLDVPLSPADIFQFVGRMDRVGQSSPFLNIYFMLMKDTIEFNIIKNLKEQKKLTDNLFDEESLDLFSAESLDLGKLL